MSYEPDPELNRLVRELNQSEEPPSGLESAPHTADADDPQLRSLLSNAVGKNATDILLLEGVPPAFRMDGAVVRTSEEPLTGGDFRRMFAPWLTPSMLERLTLSGAIDFSLRLELENVQSAHRFRVNLHRQRGQLAASLRVLPQQIPSLDELGLPASAAKLVEAKRGLILLCGPTGAGKTTTLAALVDRINRERSHHIVTIEDPIEYEHRNERSLIEQIEIGRDSPDFANALRAALRQNPDVILLGEMRDHETISTAITAAETGHLILATLHTSSSAQAIHRIVDVFPAAQQTQVRHQLALGLHAVLTQQLIPRADGRGRVLAVELLLANPAIRNHIRRDALQHLHSEITLGKRNGMVTFEDSLAALSAKGLISADEARLRASNPDEIDSLLR